MSDELQVGGYQPVHAKGFEYDPNDPRPYADQYAAWALCRDTWGMYDITNYPGSRSEQVTEQQPAPAVVTSRSMARFRR